MKFQRELSNGSWINEDRVDYFIDKVLERETWFAPRQNREPMTTREQVLSYLETGKIIHYGDDWYAEIRDADAIKPRQSVQVKMVKCDCGHETAHPMSTSRGTSCPDCYDRMSDF